MTSVVDRTTVTDVLVMAGVAAPNDARKLMRCPLHDDRTSSFRVFERGWVCFGCNQRGGVLDLVVALGLARNRPLAARWLEGRVR